MCVNTTMNKTDKRYKFKPSDKMYRHETVHSVVRPTKPAVNGVKKINRLNVPHMGVGKKWAPYVSAAKGGVLGFLGSLATGKNAWEGAKHGAKKAYSLHNRVEGNRTPWMGKRKRILTK